jgi:hypothetical protein
MAAAMPVDGPPVRKPEPILAPQRPLPEPPRQMPPPTGRRRTVPVPSILEAPDENLAHERSLWGTLRRYIRG